MLQPALTITAESKGQVYGAGLPMLTASYSGFVNGDTAASLDTPVKLGTTATLGSPVGAVQFKVDGLNAGPAVPLTSGVAACSTASPAVGFHSVSAESAGSLNINGTTNILGADQLSTRRPWRVVTLSNDGRPTGPRWPSRSCSRMTAMPMTTLSRGSSVTGSCAPPGTTRRRELA